MDNDREAREEAIAAAARARHEEEVRKAKELVDRLRAQHPKTDRPLSSLPGSTATMVITREMRQGAAEHAKQIEEKLPRRDRE